MRKRAPTTHDLPYDGAKQRSFVFTRAEEEKKATACRLLVVELLRRRDNKKQNK
jgi:hypothetical protein